MSLHRALVQYDRLFSEAESIRIERDKLRAENAELRNLVQDAYIAGCNSHGIITWWGDFQEYKAQHQILKEQP